MSHLLRLKSMYLITLLSFFFSGQITYTFMLFLSKLIDILFFQGELESRIAELETLKRQMGNTGAAESSLTVESEKVRKHFIVLLNTN